MGSKLIDSLKTDEKLEKNKDLKAMLISMAELFLENFGDNMYKTSIELNEAIPYFSIDAWREFLNYPIVRKYIKSFKDEKIDIIADQNLASGNDSAVRIKKALSEEGPNVNNSNIVLIRLPEKRDFDEE